MAAQRSAAASAVMAASPAAALLEGFSHAPATAAGAMRRSSSSGVLQKGSQVLSAAAGEPRQRRTGAAARRDQQQATLHWLLASRELQQQFQQQLQLQRRHVGFRSLWGGGLSPAERVAATRERLQELLLQRRRAFAAAAPLPDSRYSRGSAGTEGSSSSSKGESGEPSSVSGAADSGSNYGGGSSTFGRSGFAYSSNPEKQQKVVEAVRRGDAEPSGPGFTFKGTQLQPDELPPEKLRQLQQQQTEKNDPFLSETPECQAAREAATASAEAGGESTAAAATRAAAAARDLGAAGAEALREKAATVKEKVKEGAGIAAAAAKENMTGAAESMKEGAGAARDSVKGKAAAATETVKEGAAAAGRAVRETASKTASASGSTASKLLLAGGAGLLLYGMWGGCSLMRETDALRAAWDFVKKDERVKAQMGRDFTRERWWGGFEHADAARVKLRLRGRNGERGLAVCDLTREHPGAQWKVLVVNFVRTDDRGPPPSPPQRQQPQHHQQPPAQQTQAVQPQQHLQQQQARQQGAQLHREKEQEQQQKQGGGEEEEEARQLHKAKKQVEEEEQRQQRQQHGASKQDRELQRRVEAQLDRAARGVPQPVAQQQHVEKHPTKDKKSDTVQQERQHSKVGGDRENLKEEEDAKSPRERPAAPREDEKEEELFRREGHTTPLHSSNRMQAQKLPAVPAGAFKPPLEEETIPWKVTAIEKEESLKRGGELRSGPVPPPAPHTRP